MFDFLKKPFERIRTKRELAERRDQVLSEALIFGLELKADFHDWFLSAGESYSRERLSERSRSKFESDFKSTVECIVEKVFSHWDHGRAPRRLKYDRFMDTTFIGPAEAVVAAKLSGVGLKGGPYCGSRGRTGFAMTGAQVTGTISLRCSGDLPPFTRSIFGKILPPDTIHEGEAWFGPPFAKAIVASNLKKTLSDMLNRFYSSPDTNKENIIRREAENQQARKIWEAKKKKEREERRARAQAYAKSLSAEEREQIEKLMRMFR